MQTRTITIKALLLLSGFASACAYGYERNGRAEAAPTAQPIWQNMDTAPSSPTASAQQVDIAPAISPPSPPATQSTDFESNAAAKKQFNKVFDSVYQALGKDGIDAAQQDFSGSRHLTDGQTVSVEFIEANIREAFAELGNQTGIPFILEEGVQGFVSLKQEKAPLKKVMEMMLVAGGYRYKEMENYILIGIPDSQNPVFDDIKKTETVNPAFLKPTEILSLLSDKYVKLVKANDDNNTIAVTADPITLARIQDDIAKIDQRPEQIMLEVLVVDISKTAKSRMGIDWWSSSSGTLAAPVNGKTLGFEGVEESFKLLSPLNMLSLRIESLVDIGEAKIWASPKVLTSNGKKANISVKSIETLPIVSGPQQYLQVETKNFESGVSMMITPKVSNDGSINLVIENAQVATIEMAGEAQTTGERLPVLTSRAISTNVTMQNNETLVIGGLLDVRGSENDKNIPGLGTGMFDKIFGAEQAKRETRDLLIFITPRVMKDKKLNLG
jgi:type II secretory pathway component GspD/PulD (secretin)